MRIGKFRIYIILTLIFTGIISCNNPFLPIYFENTRTENIFIEILEPAVFTISPEIEHVDILSVPLHFDINIPTDSSAEAYFSKFKESYMESCMESLLTLLGSSPRFTARLIDTLNGAPGQLNKDAFIQCEYIKHTVNLDVSDKYGWNDYSFVERVYVTSYVIESEANWNLYDQNGTLLKTFSSGYTDTYVGNEEFSAQESLNTLPNLYDVLEYASIVVSEQFARKIAPTWRTVDREFYGTGSKELRTARKMVFSNEWGNAIQLWENELKSTNPVAVKHAKFNMILAEEINSNFQQALQWATKVYAKYKLEKARKYAEILRKRVEDQKLIEKQLFISTE